MVQQASQKDVFPREIAAYLDVALYVLEARAPYTTFHLERQLGGDALYVLNKADLADTTETNRWLAHLRGSGLAAVDAASNKQSALSAVGGMLAEVWRRKRETRARRGIRDTVLRVVVLGVPNTGKSTVINQLIGRKRARTGNRPGITRGHQWVRITEGIDLLDTPGIVRDYSRSKKGKPHMLALGLTPPEHNLLEQALGSVFAQLRGNGWKKLCKLYGLEAEGLEQCAAWEIVHKVGHRLKGGKMGDALEDDMGCKILADFQRGRFGRVTLEPVAEYSAQLDELLMRLREAEKADGRQRGR